MTIYKQNNIYYRYEPYIDDGVCFIFNKDTGKIFESNYEVYIVLELINGINMVVDIVKQLKEKYTINEIEKQVILVIDILCKNDVISLSDI